jgi:DNA polymerase IV (DinB-like DNA polymerase)
MCENVLARLKSEGFKTFKTLSISVRYADFQTFSSAKTLKEPANDKKTLKIESIKLLLPFLDDRKNPRGKAIRLIGVRLEKLQ